MKAWLGVDLQVCGCVLAVQGNAYEFILEVLGHVGIMTSCLASRI